jgi:hypothetical protein
VQPLGGVLGGFGQHDGTLYGQMRKAPRGLLKAILRATVSGSKVKGVRGYRDQMMVRHIVAIALLL